MEFLQYLSAKEIEIIRIIEQAEYSAEENTPLCLLGKKYFGFFKKRQKKIVICTKNAKSHGSYIKAAVNKHDNFDRIGIHIRRAVRHESVHIAQACNGGIPLGIAKEKKLKLHPYKMDAWIASSAISGKKEKEYEAYTLEDRPRIIIKALKRYCL